MTKTSLLPEISPELKFVLSCTDNTKAMKEDFSASLDWNMVLNLTITHGLFPQVYYTLSQMVLTFPEYVLKMLQQRCLSNTIKVVGLADEIVRIIKNMEENDIQPLILKGPPLSIRINEDIALRPSNDIDILVDPIEFTRAEKVLEEIDYKRISPDFQLTPRQKKNYFKKDHHFEYFHDKRAIHVELHWRLRSFNIKRFPTASNLKTQKIYIAGYPVPVMDDEYWFTYLMVHGYKHKWVRLRWLYDIKKFMEEKINWDKIISLSNNSELRPILHQTLLLLNHFFNVPIPIFLEQAIKNDQKAFKLFNIVIEELCKITKSRYSFLKDFSLRDLSYYDYSSRWENKLNYTFSIFKPQDIHYKLISLPDILFPLYYIIKPFYSLCRRIKNLLSSKNH